MCFIADDISGTFTVNGYIVEINGEKYMKARHVHMYPQVGNMKVYASNLFTGNDELSKYARQHSHLLCYTVTGIKWLHLGITIRAN